MEIPRTESRKRVKAKGKKAEGEHRSNPCDEIRIRGPRVTIQSRQPKIILLDIENTPLEGYSWEIWDTNIIEVTNPWHLLSFSVKELGAKKGHTYCLPDYKFYHKDRRQDLSLTYQLWRQLDSADVVIAHNGDRFDIKKANARFIFHGMAPPSPFKTVDTLKIARKHFKFTSNRLDDLAQYLGIGRKLPHQGKHTWLGCMAGDEKAWKVMRKYNQHDVWLLEQVYLRLRPWATTHVNLDAYTKRGACPICQSMGLIHRGWNYSKTGKRRRYQCTKEGCRAWSSAVGYIKDYAAKMA